MPNSHSLERALRFASAMTAFIAGYGLLSRASIQNSQNSLAPLVSEPKVIDPGALGGPAVSAHLRIAESQQSFDQARKEGLLVESTNARLLAPVPRPGKLICIGLNYRDHAAESKMKIPERPVVFSKFNHARTW